VWRNSHPPLTSSTTMQAARRAPRALALVRTQPFARTYATPVAYHQQEVDPQLNGYPQLPYINRQRLPAKGWDDPQLRRNFGDTVRACHCAVTNCILK
jgi:NADH dehydrogenase (ubiquinone) 1 beta subcomplex subunit 8